MLGGDDDLFVAGHKVAALLDHLGTGHLPMGAVPVKRVRLPFALDHHATLARALGHRLGHIGGVNIAVGIVIDRAFKVFGIDQRPAGLDLIRGQPFIGHTTGFGGRGIKHILVHPLFGLGHAQVADHGKAGVKAGLFLKRLVEIDRVFVDMSGRVGHVKQRQKTGGMPGRAAGQLVTLEQHDIVPPSLGQMIGNRGSDGTTADDQGFDIGFHKLRLPWCMRCPMFINPAQPRTAQPTQERAKPTLPDLSEVRRIIARNVPSRLLKNLV